MRRHLATKFVKAGHLIAEVQVEIDEDADWGPTLSIEDVRKLEEVQRLLDRGDVRAASKLSAVFEMTPVQVA